MKTIARIVVVALAACVAPSVALGWIYPEHRDIALLAVKKLTPQQRDVLAGLWAEARAGHEQRLCENPAEAALGLHPTCIDWAALPALAGDHSCSSKDLTETVLESKWVLGVAQIAAQLGDALAKVDVTPPPEQVPTDASAITDFRRRGAAESSRAARTNAMRNSDNALQRTDPRYATRASSNNAHFLLARPSTGMSAHEYGDLTMKSGSEINAVGAYGWFHLSALQKATRLAHESDLALEARRDLARAMLFDEGFAIHFLEDAFAAGHVAGTWGDTSQRKGSHDFYNGAGLEVFTWNTKGESLVLMGDAYMRPEDAERAAVAVRESLEQVLDEAAGRSREIPHTPGAPATPDAFSVCGNAPIPERSEPMPEPKKTYVQMLRKDFRQVLMGTPIPGLGPGLGAMPRFRSEIGPFVGLTGAFDGRYVDGGFTPAQGGGFVAGVDLALRVGVGLDGVMSDAGDGLVFLAFGFRGDSASSNSVSSPETAAIGGNLTSAIPSRTGLTARLRMPFYLIPGDMILLSPILLFSTSTYGNIAVTAGNGGLIPWQVGMATRYGRFQFVLGRELGVTFYGSFGDLRVMGAPEEEGAPPRLVAYESVLFDLPILEYRPYRAFDSNQSSTVLFVLFTSFDFPHSASAVAPSGATTPDLGMVWSFGVRMVFDWRYYW